MEFTRRVLVGGAMAAPLVAALTDEAIAEPGKPSADLTFTILDGQNELRLTEDARRRLGELKIEVFAVEPATVLRGADGSTVDGVRVPLECGTLALPVGGGRPTRGTGRGRGGIGMRNDKGSMEITGLRTDLADARVFGFLKVNDEWEGELPLYVADPAQIQLTLLPGTLGKPGTVRGGNIKIRPTREGLDAFQDTFGSSPFTPTDVVIIAAGESRVWPLPFFPGA